MVSIEAQCSAYGKHFSVATSQAPKVGSLVQEFTELKRRGDQVHANVTAKKLEEDVVVLQLPVLEGLKAFIDFLMALALWREDKNNGVLLMGPNGSGKSSYLRTLGLMHVLAQMGSLVPAISAEMRLTNSIHVCSPSLLKGSNHEECTQLIDAVRAATAKDRKYQNNKHRRSKNRNNRCSLEENKDEANDASLILIDEIFRSVPHAEGFSVCWAINQLPLADHYKCFLSAAGENGLTPLFKIAKNSEGKQQKTTTQKMSVYWNGTEAEAAQMAYGVLGSKGKLNKIIVEEAEAFIAEADGALMPHAQCLQTVEITRCENSSKPSALLSKHKCTLLRSGAYEIIHLLENAVSSFSIHSTTDSRNSSNTSSSNNSHRRFLRLLEEAQRVIEVVCVETDA
ncbi:hypothetical protein EAH_00058310 [Eimeria acervulina]|uniref:DNA mismatch repair proteins mutS family domain-containing protein n=1 Tax=Eimeria acervulina TaxID=5801 RepID=U6GR23_EIMAC|nr:hypothetical protein EAH_00058310 [Eimeria acervulina]CDI81034.1 hypothetical protein EAH_00058310 [Eimeria acervulina]